MKVTGLHSSLTLLKQTAATLIDRKVSEANLPFITSRINIIKMLGQSIATEGSTLSWVQQQVAYLNLDNFASVCRYLLSTLPRSQHPTRGFVKLSVPKKIALHKYDRICIMFSPEIGIGDEATFYQLLRNFPIDKCELWSTIPDIWHKFGFANTKDYRQDPTAPFRSFNFGKSNAKNLLIHIGFLDCDFIDAAYQDFNHFEHLQITLGNRQLLYWSKGKFLQSYRPHLDRSNNYKFILDLNKSIFDFDNDKMEMFARLPHAQSSNGIARKRILINPLTSKKMIVTAGDWANLTAAIISKYEFKEALELTILPGFTNATKKYAQNIAVKLQQKFRKANVQLLRDRQGNIGDERNTMGLILDYMDHCNLMIGIDTFTAHLSSLFDIPSFTVFYRDDGVFRVPAITQFNLHLSAGMDAIIRASETYVALQKPAFRDQLKNKQLQAAEKIAALSSALKEELEQDSEIESRDYFFELVNSRDKVRNILTPSTYAILTAVCGRPELFDLPSIEGYEHLPKIDIQNMVFSWLHSPIYSIIENLTQNAHAETMAAKGYIN